MHILHLAIFPDVLISLLCDLTDDVRSRDAELDILWNNYKGLVRRASCARPGISQVVLIGNPQAQCERVRDDLSKVAQRHRCSIYDLLAGTTDGFTLAAILTQLKQRVL